MYCANTDGHIQFAYHLPQQIGCFAFCSNGDFLLGLEDGVYRMDKNQNIILAHQPMKIKGRRFNDGKIGPDSAFYLGTTANDGKGAFYCLKNGKLTQLFDKVSCSNGIDWSNDGTKMYYVDSPLRRIEVFDFNADSTKPLSNRRVLIDLDNLLPPNAVPDGMTIDLSDNLYVAIWNGKQVLKINGKTGELIDYIEVEANKPSSCTFYGKLYNKLLITTSRFEENDECAGSLYVSYVHPSGKPVNFYKY